MAGLLLFDYIFRIPNGHYKVGKLFLADISNAAKGMRDLKRREGLDKRFLLGILKNYFCKGLRVKGLRDRIGRADVCDAGNGQGVELGIVSDEVIGSG